MRKSLFPSIVVLGLGILSISLSAKAEPNTEDASKKPASPSASALKPDLTTLSVVGGYVSRNNVEGKLVGQGVVGGEFRYRRLNAPEENGSVYTHPVLRAQIGGTSKNKELDDEGMALKFDVNIGGGVTLASGRFGKSTTCSPVAGGSLALDVDQPNGPKGKSVDHIFMGPEAGALCRFGENSAMLLVARAGIGPIANKGGGYNLSGATMVVIDNLVFIDAEAGIWRRPGTEDRAVSEQYAKALVGVRYPKGIDKMTPYLGIEVTGRKFKGLLREDLNNPAPDAPSEHKAITATAAAGVAF